jgi:hypothetical protein
MKSDNPPAAGVLATGSRTASTSSRPARGRPRSLPPTPARIPGRCAGDFFRDPLPACDTYLIMDVIHDWTDDQAAALLSAVREAALPRARVLVIETILADVPGPDWSKSWTSSCCGSAAAGSVAAANTSSC